MAIDLFAEKVDWFRQNEKPEVVLLITDDPLLIKILVTWSYLEISHPLKFTDNSSATENEIWKLLWKNTRFSMTELKAKSGLSITEHAVGCKVNHLISNRVIYPDGTINSFVQRYLREKVLTLFVNKKNSSRARL
jgi:hypothetical protein